MSLIKYVERLKKMDDLIRRKATGTPDEFAEKLRISKSMLMVNLIELKKMGAPVRYNGTGKHYFYEKDCSLKLGFELQEQDLLMVKGGKNFLRSNSIRMEFTLFTVQAFES